MRVLRCLMVFYNFAYGCGVWWRNGDTISSRTPKRRRTRIAFPDSDVRILMAVLLGGATYSRRHRLLSRHFCSTSLGSSQRKCQICRYATAPTTINEGGDAARPRLKEAVIEIERMIGIICEWHMLCHPRMVGSNSE